MLIEQGLRAQLSVQSFVTGQVGVELDFYPDMPMGAVVYEKHFTLDRNLPGPDHRMSLTVDELKYTVRLIRDAEVALGRSEKRVLDSEQENRIKLRKSLVAKVSLSRGQILERGHIIAKRPGDGLPPSDVDGLMGKRLKVDVLEDEKLDPSMVE